MVAPLLKVQNLCIELNTHAGIAPVIDDLSFELGHDECISFVGESGCGKSMTALGIMGLLPENIGRIASGSIQFNGEELTAASDARLRDIPIIMITSRSGEKHRERAVRAGANAYLTKPYKEAELISTVHRLLGGEEEPDE